MHIVDSRFRRPSSNMNRFSLQYSRRGKRVFDLVLAVPLLLSFAPLILVFLALVALDGHNPLFGQARVGRGGRLFQCWKIRSMVPDATERLAALLASDRASADEWVEHQKLADDPRITRIGNFLRRTSLDELPQLWNVIRGDMSLVGPRPVIEEELERYGDHSPAYKSLNPGLTGPWQVTARNIVTYDERVLMDAAYARNYSLLGDLYLIAMTLVAVMARTGR